LPPVLLSLETACLLIVYQLSLSFALFA